MENLIEIIIVSLIVIFFGPFSVYLMVIADHKKEYEKNKKEDLGTLTGNYVHCKTIKGNILLVEHNINNKKMFKEASVKDVLILTKYKLLK